MPHKTTIKTNGQTLTVKASVSHWTTEALALAASGTNDVESTTTTTITSDYDLWFANTATTATITVKQLDGTTLATYADLQVNPGVGVRTLSPIPDGYQAAADSGVNRLSLAPAGALAETFPRAGGPTTNIAVPGVSGRLFMTAIHLQAGMTVSSITYTSVTTAAVAPTAQWFALYNSSRVLLRQTADDTSTAWGATTVKTLSLTTPFTTTYTGLHYVAINVTAGTVPSLLGASVTSTGLGIAPVLSGASTTGLTDTAPATADAITAAGLIPYAYVT